MNLLVAIKHAIDYEVDVSVNAAGTAVETERVSFAMNPFDEVALEAAIQLKEQGIAKHVLAVCIGRADAENTLRSAIASGADEAILIKSAEADNSLNIAKCLEAIVVKRKVSGVLLGKQSLDKENAQTGAMLASLLGYPLLTCVQKIESHTPKLHVTRTTDYGMETYAVTAPYVLTCQLSLCQPRFASLPDIMRAKKTKVECVTPDLLGVTLSECAHTIAARPPTPRSACQFIDSAEELATLIQSREQKL